MVSCLQINKCPHKELIEGRRSVLHKNPLMALEQKSLWISPGEEFSEEFRRAHPTWSNVHVVLRVYFYDGFDWLQIKKLYRQ